MKFIEIITSRSFAIAILILSLVLLLFFKYFPDYYTKWILILPLFILLSISLSLYRRIRKRVQPWTKHFVGSVLFHIGMIVVMISIISGETSRYWSSVIIPRYMPVVVETSVFTTTYSVPAFADDPFIKISLDWQDSAFEEDRFAVDHAAGLTIGLIKDDEYVETLETIRINQPVWRDGYQFLLRGGGFVYLLNITDKDGKHVFSDHRATPTSLAVEDSFIVENEGFEVFVRYFPELVSEDGKYGTLSREALNPALGVRIVENKDPFNDAWKGLIKSRETAKYGDYTLKFVDLRPYVTVEILKDPSYYGIIAGWLFIVFGLLMRYLFVKEMSKEIG